jgi:DDE superfamily endonuclease
MLQYHFNWKVLSASAGITWWNFYFRLYRTTIRAPQVVDFLGHLLRHLPGKLLVVWDGLPAHRARLVSDFIRAQRGRLAIEWLPGYAPELNSGGIHLGLLETTRASQLLPPRFRPAQPPRPPRAPTDAPAPAAGEVILASSKTVTINCRTQ